jgi:hypothetical protein
LTASEPAAAPNQPVGGLARPVEGDRLHGGGEPAAVHGGVVLGEHPQFGGHRPGVSQVGRGDQVEDRPGRRGNVDAERAERVHPAAPAGVGCQLAGDG